MRIQLDEKNDKLFAGMLLVRNSAGEIQTKEEISCARDLAYVIVWDFAKQGVYGLCNFLTDGGIFFPEEGIIDHINDDKYGYRELKVSELKSMIENKYIER